jgi:DNA polymerase III subunit delta
LAELKSVYLITGGDRPKVARALQRLRSRVGEDAVELLSARNTSGEEAVAACNAPGLFGSGGRLVIVEEAEAWRAPDVKALSAYLSDPAPDTVLALTGQLKADSALAKACAKGGGETLVYEVPRRALPRWVGEQFARAGASADEEACRTLVEIVGNDLDELVTEVDKLATWAAGEPIGVREVEALATGRAETPIFALTDAWGRRDVPGVLAACEELLERTDRSRRDALARLAGSMASHVSRVRACQSLAAEGLRPRDGAARLQLHPFAAEKAFAQAANFTVDELRDAVVRLGELDFALKGGSRLAGDLELQRTLVEITQPREPADLRVV